MKKRKFNFRLFRKENFESFKVLILRERWNMSKMKSVVGGVLLLALSSSPALAGKADAGKWINNEFQPSTLSKV